MMLLPFNENSFVEFFSELDTFAEDIRNGELFKTAVATLFFFDLAVLLVMIIVLD